MEAIMAVAIVGIISFTIYRLFELYARRKERLSIIEKFSSGIDPEVLKNQFSLPLYKDINNGYGSWAIRIGLLLVGIGLGVIIAAIIDLLAVPPVTDGHLFYEFRHTIDVLYPSFAAVFGGLGLVIAYIVEKKDAKRNPQD